MSTPAITSKRKKFERRAYEKVALVAVRQERVITLFWTRRGRKSTTLGAIAFDEMSKEPGRTVIAASASLLLGSELVNMTVSATEQAIIVANEAAAVRAVFEDNAEAQNLDFRVANSETGKIYEGGLTRDDFAHLYQSKRLEMRLYHDKTTYSRELIIAPVPATARGWRGTVLRDEAGFTGVALETALREAVDPIFRDVPDLKMIYASNLGRDDRHPFFTMTLPPPEMDFAANPQGHFYRGENGVLIHRVALADAYAAGHVLFDNKGRPMTLEQFRSDPANKAQLPYNYDLIHTAGGTAAIDLLALLTAQQRGAAQGAFVYVDDERSWRHSLDLLRAHLGDGEVGLGFDVATTTRETSNPSSLTVTEKRGVERLQRLVAVWKERNPAVVRERLKDVVRVVREARGKAPRRLCIDATNERYFAEDTKTALAGVVPVELVISSLSVEPLPPGYREAVNYKTYLGDLYSAAVNDNRYALPSAEYLKLDHRIPVKDAGRYVADPDPQTGAHGDTFDSGKLAEYAVGGGGAPFGFSNLSEADLDRGSIGRRVVDEIAEDAGRRLALA
ncbi:MAG: hypothetical protein JO295_13620 [Verrucomicrobia bacterium]|nr:hypothetical protein [Verrucomicrobiota bacterium]